MKRRSYSHLGPAVSLNSFVLGFLIGCAVFYVLHCTGSWDVCIGCESDRAPLPYLPPSLPTPCVSLPPAPTHVSSPSPAAAGNRCPDAPLRLVILVLSTPDGSLRRNAIRGTWMYDTPPDEVELTVKFLLGTKHLTPEQLNSLSSEEDMFHDLLFLTHHKETYSNLTGKVLQGIMWVDKNLDFDYLVKVDDDSYVSVRPLNFALRHRLCCPPRLYWGYFTGHAVPLSAGRWAERHWTLCPHYLPYAMGGGYILSRHVVGLIGRFHKQFKFYSNEDVSLGSWLAPFNVTYKHDLRFNTEGTSHGCKNHYIISHKESVRGMYEKYVHLKKTGELCPEEKEIRPSYVYNWNADSPMDCCTKVKGLTVYDDP